MLGIMEVYEAFKCVCVCVGRAAHGGRKWEWGAAMGEESQVVSFTTRQRLLTAYRTLSCGRQKTYDSGFSLDNVCRDFLPARDHLPGVV